MKLNRVIPMFLAALTLTSFSFPTYDTVAENKIKQDNIGDSGKVTKRTAVKYDGKSKITQSLQFDFIDDPNYDKNALVVKAMGSIPSGEYFNYINPDGRYPQAEFWFPAEYHIKLNVDDNNQGTEVINSLPKNNVDTVNVDETMGYSIGGSITSQKALSLRGSYNYSKSISYKQENFKTILTDNTNNKATEWKVVADKLKYGDRIKAREDKYLFFKVDNNTDEKKPETYFAGTAFLPALIKSGFNPEFLTYLSNEKSNKKTKFKVEYKRNHDEITAALRDYEDSPRTFYRKNERGVGYVVTYEVDWENKKVKAVETKSVKYFRDQLDND